MMYNYNEYLPCSKIEIVITVDDENNDNNYLPWEVTGVVVENYDDNYYMTNKIITYDLTDVDGTILDRDLIYDIEIVNEYEMFDNYYDYNVSNNKIYSLKNKINRPKIRMLFNDGG